MKRFFTNSINQALAPILSATAARALLAKNPLQNIVYT